MAIVFMIGLMYSKYWLLSNSTPESYLMMRHFKYTLASFGQWLTQNMAHVTVFSVTGKLLAVAGIGYYSWRRFIDHRSALKHGGSVSNSVGKI
jgi:hypothetical protein